MREPLPQPLDRTAYLVADNWSSDPGRAGAGGPSTLVTYPATAQTFCSAQQFTLYRYVGQALSGPIAAYPVESLTMTDGFGVTYRTAYEFDAATALSDPTGTVIKFYRSASYDGAEVVADSTFGRTVFSYYNGTTTASAYSALDGRLQQQVHFAGAARFQRQWSDALGLGGLKPNGAPQAVAAPLADAFATAGSPLGAGATVQMVEVDDVYVYWQVDDPAHATAYNLDYTGDPRDQAGLRVFDGQAVTSSTTQWTVFTTRNSDPTTADKTPLPLHGGYSRPSTITGRSDGVPLTTTLDYVPAGFAAPFSGLPVTESFGFVNLGGAVEQHVKARKYASEVYREVLGINLLTPVVQTRQTVATGGSPLTVAATATTGVGWTRSSGNQLTVWGSSEQWVWSGDPSGADVGEFPFGGTPNDFWQRNSTANARNDAGLIVDSTDASGLRHGTLYDRGTQAEVALVSNGSFAAGQAAYAGFEAYEDLSAWSLTGGAALDDTDANSGAWSLRLPTGGAATRAAITPDPAQPQFFSAWVKTPAGYTGGAGSGWTLTVRVGAEVVGAPVGLAFADTGGAWRHVCAPLDLKALTADTTGAVTVTVAAANAGSAAVWVDDMIFVPLASQFVARAYDPVFMLPSDRLDQTGKHWRTVRDPFMRPVGGTDAAGNPTSLQLTYFSRAGNADAFEAADPNAALAVKSFGSGRYESFRDGQGWQAGWTAAPAGAWEASGGVLRHASTAAGATLTPVEAPPAGELALYLQLVSLDSGPLELTDDFSIAVGDATFTYGAAARAWKLTLAGSPVPPLGKVTGPPAACLLVQTGGRLLLYADGQLLFAQQAAPTGAPVVSCGANAVGLANLALFAEPALNLHFSDATGMLRQQQVLTAEDYLVQQTVRDARGKPIVHTKPAPGAFESGASLPVPAYRPGFVNVAAFAAVLEGSSVMKGDVASWYDGHHDTDDAGYPYSRCRLEPSSLARTLELGFPGAALAIVDPGSTPPSSRATVQNQYGANTEGELDFGPGALPPQSFQVHRQVGQTKVVQATISDASRTVAARMVAGDEPQVNTTQPRYAPGTTTTVSVLPDAFSLGETGQQVTRASNAAGALMGRRTPDGDAVRLMYDSGGRVRFAQDAQGALDNTLVYLTWDALGRRLSRGTVDFDWTEQTEAALRGFADEPSWPESQNLAAFTRLRAWSYDGDGSHAASVGQLVGVTSSAGGVTVAETFAHNSDGTLAARTVDITNGGHPLGSFSTAFAHDAQGRLTSIAYPGATGVEQVRYRYDGRDNVLAITDGHGRAFAAWTYNPLGKPATVALGETAAGGGLTWDPAGRLVSTRVASDSTSFSYDLAYAATGALQALDEETKGDGVSDAASVIYKYDELERLLSATDAHGARTLKLGYATSGGALDQNGNLQTIAAAGGAEARLSYEPATNRVATVDRGSGAVADYTWRANGQLASRTAAPGAPAVDVGYVPGTALPATLSDPDSAAKVRLGYDGNGQRVLKQVGDASPELFVNAGAAGPLLSVDASGTATAWIYGPAGLVGMVREGRRYSVATDYLRSPRVVFDADGKLAAAYSYNAFGQVAAATEPSPHWLPFGFAGRQWDAEVGLAYFGARLYDPSTGRFLAPDPRGQYASAYVYVGNQPTMLVDPSGELSEFAEAGIEMGLAILFAAATIATLGASAAVIPAAVAAGGVVAGVAAGAAIGAVGGAVSGLAYQALKYDLSTPPGKWDSSKFVSSLWIGAAAGAAGGALIGGIGAAFTPAAAADNVAADVLELGNDDAVPISEPQPEGEVVPKEPSEGEKLPLVRNQRWLEHEAAQAKAAEQWTTFTKLAPRQIIVGTVGGSLGNALQGSMQQLLTNLVDDQPLGKGVARAAGLWALSGAIAGGVGGAGGAWNDAYDTLSSVLTAIGKDKLGYSVMGVLTVGGGLYSLALYNKSLDSKTLNSYGSN